MKKTIGRPPAKNLLKPNNKVGKIISTVRRRRDTSLREAADVLGIERQFISNIERGRAPLPMKCINKLSKWAKIPKKDVIIAMMTDKYGKRIMKIVLD